MFSYWVFQLAVYCLYHFIYNRVLIGYAGFFVVCKYYHDATCLAISNWAVDLERYNQYCKDNFEQCTRYNYITKAMLA